MAKNTTEPQRSAALKVAETRRRRKTKEAIYKVLWLSHKLQDKLMCECVIDDDLYALARHFRWRAVCSGGKEGASEPASDLHLDVQEGGVSHQPDAGRDCLHTRQEKDVAEPTRDRSIRIAA
jgi:hypothetical protein